MGAARVIRIRAISGALIEECSRIESITVVHVKSR